MKRGDWIELRDAPNTRGMVWNDSFEQKVAIRLSGDRRASPFSLADVQEHWEPMTFDGAPMPFWCQKKTTFRPKVGAHVYIPREGFSFHVAGMETPAVAEVIDVRPGWVAYQFKRNSRAASLFLMTPWWEFRQNYDPITPPTSWAHLLHAEDG